MQGSRVRRRPLSLSILPLLALLLPVCWGCKMPGSSPSSGSPTTT